MEKCRRDETVENRNRLAIAERPSLAGIVGVNVTNIRSQVDDAIGAEQQQPYEWGESGWRFPTPHGAEPATIDHQRRHEENGSECDERDAEMQRQHGGLLRRHDGPRSKARLKEQEQNHDER